MRNLRTVSRMCGWKRSLLLAAAGVISLVVSFTVVAQQPAVVRLWNWNVHDKKYQQKMYKLFNERHPDIKIEYSSISNTVYAQTLEAAFVAKEPPDIFLPDGKYTFEYLRDNNLLMPLNNLAPSEKELKDWMATYPPESYGFVEGSNIINGKVLSFGIGGTYGGYFSLFYNKTLFKEAGVAKPPATYTELRQTAAKIAQAGQGKYFGIVHGLRYAGAWDMDLICSLAQAAGFPSGQTGYLPEWGRGFDRRTGKWVYESPVFTNALKVWIGMRADGSVFPGDMTFEDEQAKMLFGTNKAALIFGGPWNVSNTYAYNPDVDFDVVLSPTPDDGVRRGYYTNFGIPGGTGTICVPASTKNPRAVWEVIKFISGMEYQEGYVKGGYGASFLPAANKPENFIGQPQMAKWVEWAYSEGRLGPKVSKEDEKLQAYLPGIYPTARDVLDTIYIGKADFDTLADLDKRLDEAVDIAIKKAQEAGVKVQKKDYIFPDWDPAVNYARKPGQ